METIGDPVLYYLERIVNYHNYRYQHPSAPVRIPPRFATYADEDQRIWLANLLLLIFPDPLNAPTDLAPAPEVAAYIDGGPRPKTTW